MLETAELALKAYGIDYALMDLDNPVRVSFQFDVVLLYGVLYHLKNPYMGMLNAKNLCKPGGMVIVESAISQGKAAQLPDDIPAMWIIDEVHHGDPTNYYMPNEAAIIQLAKMAGLTPEGEPAYIASGNKRMTRVFRASLKDS
jgi:tRNA (mo5U34)-methyltransferase